MVMPDITISICPLSNSSLMVAFSTSGKSREVLEILELARHLGVATIIGVTSHPDSALREYSDIVLPVNSWVEMEDYECGGSCSNPFLQVWKGGIKPVHDTIDDAAVFAGVARAFTDFTGDQRFADYFKFVSEKKAKIYIQRVFDNSTTTRGKDGPYNVDRLIAGEYGGEPGAGLMLFRTYPRVPFW